MNLFCFVHAGGSSSYFAQWQKHFSDLINVIPVEYPMREKRFMDSMPASLLKLSESIANENVSFFKDKPFAFFGHCTGGLIAYECAKYLSKYLDIKCVYLFISSLLAPEFAHIPSVENLSDKEFIEFIIKSGFVDRAICENDEILEYFIPIVRADFCIHERYSIVDNSPINVPIACFNGNQDNHVDNNLDKLKAWAKYSSKSFNMFFYDGNHFYLEKKLPQLSSQLQEFMLNERKTVK